MLSRIRGVDLVVARAEPESVASSRGGHAEVLPLPLGSSVVTCSVRLRAEAARFLMLNRPPPLLGDGAALLRSPDRRRRSGDCAEELGAIRKYRARSALAAAGEGTPADDKRLQGMADAPPLIRPLRHDDIASAGMPSHRGDERATESDGARAHPMEVNMEATYKPPKPKKREVRRF